MKMLTDNLVYPPQADPRLTFFSLLTSNFSLPLLCAYKLNMPNKPNFQKTRLTVTLDMIRTYNDIFPKKRKKNKPKTHQKRTKIEKKRTKTNQNEQNSTPKIPPKPNPNPIFKNRCNNQAGRRHCHSPQHLRRLR